MNGTILFFKVNFMAEKILENVKVRDIRRLIIENPTTITPEKNMTELLEKIIQTPSTRHIYVIDNNNKLIGSIRLNEIVAYLFPYKVLAINNFHIQSISKSLYANTVEDIMNMKPDFVNDGTSITRLVDIMLRKKINELPVVDAKQCIIGEVNILEVVYAYLEKKR